LSDNVRELRTGPHSISLVSLEEAVEWVLAAVDEADGPCKQVMASGFHGLWAAVSNAQTSDELSHVDLWVPDGIAPVLMARLLGASEVARVPGPDLFPAVMKAAPVEAVLRHFLYGDTDDTLEALHRHIEATYPRNEVVGVHSPPFTPAAKVAPSETIDEINNSGADILWVGLGTPKQDLWIARNRHLLQVPVAVAVGAAFRFEIGKVDRAPDWVGRSGLEWAYRLTREPRKLWRRVFLEGGQFLAWSAWAMATGRVTLAEREIEAD